MRRVEPWAHALLGLRFLSRCSAPRRAVTVDDPADEPAAGWARHGFRGQVADLLAERTLLRAWRARWESAPSAPALSGPDGRFLTAGELAERTAAVAGRYAAAGLGRGDRLLLSGGTTLAVALAHVAALRLGLVVVPVSPTYGASEIGSVARAAAPELAVLDDPARLPGIRSLALEDLEVGRPVLPPPDLDRASAEEGALLLFTSGTTGPPKGVLLSHANLLASSASVGAAWRWSPEDRLVLSLPLFHLHGLGVGLHGTLLAGASAVLLPRFDPDLVLDAAASTRATLLFGVPTMWVRLAASSRVAELGRLRLCISGSAPLAPEVFDALAERGGTRVVERYGMTETGMLASNPVEGERRPGTVGVALPGVSIRLAPGTAADEIVVRGPGVFAGYRTGAGRDGPDRGAFEAGWFRTGDLGTFDEDGYLRIVGRAKELIITGGFNVHPREVEEALGRHPAVVEAAVVGVEDPEWGERVVAYVVVAEPLAEGQLLAFAADHLAPYKRPRQIRFVDALPRNALGKVTKADLR